ncbi:hypothetical protein ACLGI4_01955 [Streptomyces sp. HMX112]|uniref:hypothetical protein n=1 Tax=Streptomyces sp. HMX112 TaxID=3390850 RepID=UPI003A80C1CC
MNVTCAGRSAGVAGPLEVPEVRGAVLTAMARVTPSGGWAHRVCGVPDTEGPAAMCSSPPHDTLRDSAGVAPASLPHTRVLPRLFADAPTGAQPWATSPAATGRGELPGRERLTSWRW